MSNVKLLWVLYPMFPEWCGFSVWLVIMGTGPCPVRPLGTIPLIPWHQLVSSNDCAQYLRETLWRLPRFSLCQSFSKHCVPYFSWALSSILSTRIVLWALPGFSLPVSGLETLKLGKWGQSWTSPYLFPVSQGSLSFVDWYPVFWKPLFHVFHFPSYFRLFFYSILAGSWSPLFSI